LQAQASRASALLQICRGSPQDFVGARSRAIRLIARKDRCPGPATIPDWRP